MAERRSHLELELLEPGAVTHSSALYAADTLPRVETLALHAYTPLVYAHN